MSTQILQTPSHFPSSPISSPSQNPQNALIEKPPNAQNALVEEQGEIDKEGDQLSLLAILVAVFRKSLIVGGCSCTEGGNLGIYSRMEIGSPSDVRHVAHVTFDRFDGFLGLPDEFESDVPRKPPSASASVFGVSTESMQLSFDSRGNSVPTILLMMQRRLYAQGGLQAEGIFRINADNSQDEYVREQLNKGVVPDGVDVHSLAGLIKAWFRELPKGVLDPLSPEQVMQSQSEDEYAELVKLLPSTEASLLDWAINLMADIAQLENLNKMNAHNVAMVFAPNMTQMSDPLTALMYAVQVMNFLKILIIKKLREREDSIVENTHASDIDPSDENGHDSASLPCINEEEEHESTIESRAPNFLSSIENIIRDENEFSVDNFNDNDLNEPGGKKIYCDFIPGQYNNSKKGSKKVNGRADFAQKNKGSSIVSPINSRSERLEAWR